MEKLHIYNTLTRKKEEFIPVTPGSVGIYVCGPTVYDHAHVGHAKTYISFDIVVRYLRYLGYKVRYVQNITDVGHLLGDMQEGEDRIEKQARLEKIEPMEVVELYTRSYFEDMDQLGLIRPDISPRASGHIIEQIDMIQKLIEKEYAYEKNGNIYFDVYKFKDYGKLSGRKIDQLESGIRVEVREEKKNPVDFALWKKADKSHLMRWTSPWGKGYPGWHIECSCMAIKYLGQPFDIHGGGLDNIFPHHESEIAQAEAASGKSFSRYWMHNNMVTINGSKMSKSLGNSVTIKDILKNYSPLAVRYFILMSHYRSNLDFSKEALEAAAKGIKRLHTAYNRILSAAKDPVHTKSGRKLPLDEFLQNFHAAMNDDINTPQAIAAIFDLLNVVNRCLDDTKKKPAKEQLDKLIEILSRTAGNVLGLLLKKEESVEDAMEKLNQLMEIIIDLRSQLRKEKNFQLSDKLRSDIENIGIKIKDTPDGASWESE
jgi:cysteinyl-tRNA synthetase